MTGNALVMVNHARVNEANARIEAESLAAEKTQLAQEKSVLANRNQRVVDTFVDAFRSIDPENEGVTSDMTALEVLERALARLQTDDGLAEDALTKATLLSALAHHSCHLARAIRQYSPTNRRSNCEKPIWGSSTRRH